MKKNTQNINAVTDDTRRAIAHGDEVIGGPAPTVPHTPVVTYSLGGAVVKFALDVFHDGQQVDTQVVNREYVVMAPLDVGLRQATSQFLRDLQVKG